MTYRVLVLYTQSVRADIAAQVKYLQDQQVSTETIENWFARLFDQIDGMDVDEFIRQNADSIGRRRSGTREHLPWWSQALVALGGYGNRRK